MGARAAMSCSFDLGHYAELLEAAKAGGYRFAGFEDRALGQLNYLSRLKNARAVVLPTSYIVYFSPGADRARDASKDVAGTNHAAETPEP